MAERGVVGLRVTGWLSRIVVRLMPAMMGLLVCAFSFAAGRRPPFILASGETNFGADYWTYTWWPMLALAVLGGLSAALVNLRRWPLFAVAVIGWVAFSMWAAAAAAAYYAAVKLRRRRDSAIFLLCALALIVVPYAVGAFSRDDGNRDLILALGVATASVIVVLPYVAGLWVKARREVLVGLRERAHRLEQDQAVRSEQARTEERERIAREMHDVLAHRVTLMVLHAGALEVSGAGERVAEEAALIRNTGRAALAELRQVLGVLRAGAASRNGTDGVAVADAEALAPTPVLADVDRLLADARAAGLPVTRSDEGVPRELPLATGRAAHRVIQEALTNVAKHAAGAPATVTVRWLPDALELVVTSGPPVCRSEPMPAGGFGLVGLRERVELLRGRFEANRRLDGGFLVRAVIPADAAEAAL